MARRLSLANENSPYISGYGKAVNLYSKQPKRRRNKPFTPSDSVTFPNGNVDPDYPYDRYVSYISGSASNKLSWFSVRLSAHIKHKLTDFENLIN